MSVLNQRKLALLVTFIMNILVLQEGQTRFKEELQYKWMIGNNGMAEEKEGSIAS